MNTKTIKLIGAVLFALFSVACLFWLFREFSVAHQKSIEVDYGRVFFRGVGVLFWSAVSFALYRSATKGASKRAAIISEIEKFTASQPFTPFTLILPYGKQLRVPTARHIAIPPNGGRVFVFSDGDKYEVVAPLTIHKITVDS